MSIEFNRAARRKQERKAKNRKSGMVALSVMATTSLMSSYVSLLRTEPSFAVADTSGCSSVLPLTIDVSGTRSEDVARIRDLQADLNTAISESTDRCVTVTFNPGPGAGEDVLNFTNPSNPGEFLNINDYTDLELFSTGEGNNPKIIFIGNDVTLDFSFEYSFYGIEEFDESPIQTNLALEIHDITFQNSFVTGEGVAGGVIYAEDNLSIYDSQFLSNTVVRGNGGAVSASDNAVISNTTFRSNTAEGGNGGALVVDEDATISGSNFENNEAYEYYNGNSNVRGDGGAVHAYTELSITDSTFTSNSSDSEGGAVWAFNELTVSGSTFDDNYASDEGGAVFLNFASYSGEGSSGISDSTFNINTSEDSGGAVFVAIDAYGSNDGNFSTGEGWRAAFTIATSTFNDNSSANRGGAVGVDSYTYVTGSTFEGNHSDGYGGAIYADDAYITVVSSTFLNNDASWGGAIYFDEAHADVLSSTFEGNSTLTHGGAIYADSPFIRVYDSTFVDNSADVHGGAILFSDDFNNIRGSTFVGNSAGEDGGAVYLNSDADFNEISNSTFVANYALDQAGAIYSVDENAISFNTFLDNVSDSADTSDTKRARGESLSIGEGAVIGNIFAGDSQYPQIEFKSDSDSQYNLSTGEDFTDDSTNRDNVLESDLYLDSELRDNDTANNSQTLAIMNDQSLAAGFVPFSTAEGWLGSEPRDQRGVLRSAAFVNAGAFEGFIARAVPAFTPATFYVLNVGATSPKAGSVVKVSGLLLNQVTEVYVGNTKVKLTKSSDGELSFKLPRSISGPVNVRFVGAGLDHIHVLNVDGSIRNEAVVPGFGSNSTKLTKAMKNEIKDFVEANSGLNTVTCKGFTSAPATRQDLRLAKERGQATCDYIKTLNPQLEV